MTRSAEVRYAESRSGTTPSRDPAQEGDPDLVALLGRGDGLCLDRGCGTGLYFDVIRSTGRTPIGLELSGDATSTAVRAVGAIIGAGLSITRVVEPRTDPIPAVIGIRADKLAGPFDTFSSPGAASG